MIEYLIARDERATIVRLKGRLQELEGASELLRIIGELVRGGNRKILLDCGALTYMDTDGIGAFAGLVGLIICNDCNVKFSPVQSLTCLKCSRTVTSVDYRCTEMALRQTRGMWTPPWGQLKILNMPARQLDLMQLVGLDTGFAFFDNEAKALMSFS